MLPANGTGAARQVAAKHRAHVKHFTYTLTLQNQHAARRDVRYGLDAGASFN
jgi:hypothetical protein